jgi:hypothetical protein
MTQIQDEAHDWLGQQLCCDTCVHRELIGEEKCRQHHVCVEDRSPSRIDRFFELNPGLANRFLAHPYFEVRAAAARYADIFHLTALLDDSDETVRWAAAFRLPHRFLLRLRNDPHREVRIRVAAHLEGDELLPMMSDPDYYVRQVVARRIAIAQLKHMIDDPDPEVRRQVAQRISKEWLPELACDSDVSVCLAAASRLTPTQLLPLRFHPEFRVRYEAAGRVPVSALEAMRGDEDPVVRELVVERIATAQAHFNSGHKLIETGLVQKVDGSGQRGAVAKQIQLEERQNGDDQSAF